MTNISWDPSGRFVAAWSTSWLHAIENGYRLYEFTGNLLRDDSIDQFKDFVWRPRPPSLLTNSDKRRSDPIYVNIVHNLKKLMLWKLMLLLKKSFWL